MLELSPGSLGLAQIEELYRLPGPFRIDQPAMDAVVRSAARLGAALGSGEAIYGVNTGFGKLASVRVPPKDTAQLQRNLILSHCCGVGEPLDVPTTRLMIALKLLSLGRGASGIRWEPAALLQGLLAKGVPPVATSR